MFSLEGSIPAKASIFSSLHHSLTELAQRDGSQDLLQVHGTRDAIATKVNCMTWSRHFSFYSAKVSEAPGHQHHYTDLKDQAQTWAGLYIATPEMSRSDVDFIGNYQQNYYDDEYDWESDDDDWEVYMRSLFGTGKTCHLANFDWTCGIDLASLV